MPETFKRRFGLDWSPQYQDVFIDLVLAKHWREEPYRHGTLDPPGHHLLRAVRALFPPPAFVMSPWSEQHAEDWCCTDFCITWGGAACSKSNDYGCFAVLDWICDPHDTVTLMASTTRELLKIRSYESVLRYFNLLKRNPYFLVPGRESKTTCAILNDADADDLDGATTGSGTAKASIRGVAVNDGGSLQGAHLPYVRLILDELSEMKSHGIDARANLAIGCRNFKLFGLCNPTSYYDLGARFSVPLAGWSSVNEDSTSWETRWGRVRHHNGFASPALQDPDRYPHLINQAQIDRRLREEAGNLDARDIWVFVKGWPPRQGADDTVLTSTLIHAYRMDQPAVWRGGDQPWVAGLDPAFTSGGDACKLRFGKVGVADDGTRVLEFCDEVRIPILDSSERPATYQVVDRLRQELQDRRIPISRVAVDDSGTQSVADVIDVEIGRGCLRCNSGSGASDRPLTRLGGVKVNEKYVDTGTELWIQLAELGRGGHIRGLSPDECNQLTTRRLVPAGKRKRLEKKQEYKTRLKGFRSPDDADAASLCCEAARVSLGLYCGAQGLPDPGGSLGGRGLLMGPSRIETLQTIRQSAGSRLL